MALASVSTVKQPVDIFKLNIDCLYEIFEWLSLYELAAIAKTCKHFHEAAGEYFRSLYISKEISIRDGSIFTPFPIIETFLEYCPRISITCNNIKLNSTIGTHCKSLKSIRLEGALLENRIECLKEILNRVESVEIIECPNREEFYDFFLQHCHEIKSLSIKRSVNLHNKAIIIGSDNEWMRREYSTLEHFELTELYELKGKELETFFKRNPNIRTFSTDSSSLWENRSFFLATAVKFDKLAVEFVNKDIDNEVVNVLSELNERGFCKQFHVYSTRISEPCFDRLTSQPLSNAIELLHIPMHRIDMPLENIKTLGISNFYNDVSLTRTNFVCKFPNLERIYFSQSSTDAIYPFICGSTKLKAIKIKRLHGGIHFRRGCIDLPALNKEREKLNGAKKVSIFVDEYFVLLAKWSNIPTRCRLVEVKRFESYDWNELNANFRNRHLSYRC